MGRGPAIHPYAENTPRVPAPRQPGPSPLSGSDAATESALGPGRRDRVRTRAGTPGLSPLWDEAPDCRLHTSTPCVPRRSAARRHASESQGALPPVPSAATPSREASSPTTASSAVAQSASVRGAGVPRGGSLRHSSNLLLPDTLRTPCSKTLFGFGLSTFQTTRRLPLAHSERGSPALAGLESAISRRTTRDQR